MTNEQLLAAIEKKLDSKANTQDINSLEHKIDTVINDVAQIMERQTEKFQLIVENDITKRMNLLFDEYKLVHEKQWELERKVEILTRRLTEIETKVG